MKLFEKTALCLAVFALAAFAFNCGGGDQAETSAAGTADYLINLLPEENDLPGWKFAKDDARFFGPGNLWEYINGAADAFLMYGFQQVVTADYTHGPTGLDAIADIYEMLDPVNAFGIYASERSPGYTFEKIGAEGYVSATSINFWAGKYYVKLTAFEDNETLMQELRKLADTIAANISSTAGEPAELGWFPAENKVAHAAKYIPGDVLGQSYLINGYEVYYQEGANEYKMLLIQLDSPEVAENALGLYKSFIGTGGKVLKDISGTGDEGFVGEDSFYGKMAAVRTGKSLAIILSMPSESAGMSAIAELIGNIQ